MMTVWVQIGEQSLTGTLRNADNGSLYLQLSVSPSPNVPSPIKSPWL
jgi:hypothetical protein